MKTVIKNIATKVLRFPVEETGMLPLAYLVITIISLALLMRFCYC